MSRSSSLFDIRSVQPRIRDIVGNVAFLTEVDPSSTQHSAGGATEGEPGQRSVVGLALGC